MYHATTQRPDQNIIHFAYSCSFCTFPSIHRVYILLPPAALVSTAPPTVRNRSLLGLSPSLPRVSVSSFQTTSLLLSDLTLDTSFPPSTDFFLCGPFLTSKLLKSSCVCTDRPFSNSSRVTSAETGAKLRTERRRDAPPSLSAINKSPQPNRSRVFDICYRDSLAVQFISWTVRQP